jgi:DNA-binding SARP family transcriptional activator
MVQIQLLGGCRVSVEGRQADLRYDKVRLLLAWLALEPGVAQRRERLSCLLWPEADAESARRSLRHALHVLRAALGEGAGCLRSDRQTIWFEAEGIDCDVLSLAAAAARFSRELVVAEDIVALEAAAQLYGGPFLAGIDSALDPDLESWVQHQRHTAEVRAGTLWRQLASVRLASGMVREALSALHRLLDLAPLDEPANRLCMEALAAEQGSDAALVHFERFSRRLKAEWDVEPGPEIVELVARLREGAAQPAALSERRPIAVYCAQWLDEDAEGEGKAAADSALTFGQFVDFVRRRVGDGTARLVVPYPGLALVYFGLPLALEGSALAAARLAVSVASCAALAPRLAQAVHCALATVAAGETSDEPPGIVINTTLRLCALAQTGEILASEEATRWLRRDLGRRGGEAFRLIAHPYRGGVSLLRPLARRAWPHSEDLELPLVGRRSELAYLLQGLLGTRRAGASVALVGEAGLGKTRLAFEFARYAKRRGLTVWLRCARETKNEPLAPLRGWVAALAGLHPGEVDARAMARLAQLDKRSGAQGLFVELLRPLTEPAGSAAAMPASLRGLFARLLDWGAALAGRRGLTIVVDDIQWADGTTRSLLDQWIALRSARAFTIVLARETSDVPAGIQVLRPNRLELHEARALLDLVEPALRMGRDEAEAGARLADGLPLFLVEYKRHWADARSKGFDLPRNLHDLLAARLDSLSPKLRRLAACAAVLGMEGGIADLARLVDEPIGNLLPQLARFVEAGLLYPTTHDRFRFRHQALHRAALERLPGAERREWHARAAERLAPSLPPARIAVHWENADRHEEAIAAHLSAGRLAFAQGAQRDAVNEYESALVLARLHGANPATTLRGLMGKGLALIELEGYGSGEALSCFDEARVVAAMTGDMQMRLQAHWGAWLPSSPREGHDGALRYGAALLDLAIAAGDDAWQATGHEAVGNNLYFLGRLAEAERHLNAAVALGERPGVAHRLIETVGQASDVLSMAFLIWIARKRGDDAGVARAAARAVAAAERRRDAPSLAFVLSFCAIAAQLGDRPSEALGWARRTREVAEPRGYDLWIAVAVMIDNWASVRLGKTADLYGIEATLEAVSVAMPSALAICVIPYMDALLHLGAYEEALAAFERGIGVVKRYRDRQARDALWALRARCLEAMGGREAEAARSWRRVARLRRCLLAQSGEAAVG